MLENSAYETIRNVNGNTKLSVLFRLIITFPFHLIIDLYRVFNLFLLRNSENGHLIVVSNTNQMKNILNYLPEIKNNFDCLHVKNAKSGNTFPLFLLALLGFFRLLYSSKFQFKKISNLDVSEACYYKSSKYLAIFLKIINPNCIIISREDSTPFRELAKAAQSLNIKLIVIEHGTFVRKYKSFDATDTTVHVFSSIINANKRNPVAARIVATQNPIADLYQKYEAHQMPQSQAEILVGDTFNIRSNLTKICQKALEQSDVCLRFHPGQAEQSISGVRISNDKIRDLRLAKLVVTGASGFALEAALCGLPTIIIHNQREAWMTDILKIFDDFPNVLIQQYDEYIATDLENIKLSFLPKEQIVAIQSKFFFDNSIIVRRGEIMSSIGL